MNSATATVLKLNTFVIKKRYQVQNIQILSGLKVLELASVLAGPSVGQFLAECGTEVIKIENPQTQGDVTRTWKLKTEDASDSVSAYFSSANWGKKSLALDITQPEGYKVLLKLVQWADIIVASYKPGDDLKLKVDYKTLSQVKKGLIYGHITGYGRQHDKVGYDAIIQAESGFMHLNGEPNGASLKMPVALVDVLAGHQLKEGILLALIKMMQTGEGSYVEVSLYQAAISSLVNQATNWLQAGVDPQKMGSEHPNIVPYGRAYNTSDSGQIILAVGSDKQFVSLCKILNRNDLAQNNDFKTNADRVKNRIELNQELQSAIIQWTQKDLLGRLDENKIPAGAINTVSKAFENSITEELILKNNNKSGVRQLSAQMDEKAFDSSHFLPPPPYAGHTMHVLKDILSLSEQEIRQLAQKGLIHLV